MERGLFWAAVGLIVYTYVGFPLVALLRGLLRPRPVYRAEIRPKVSLIIAAYNEVGTIGRKLENVLGLDYPRGRLEVIVASDGSDDGTNEVVAQYWAAGVRLLALPRLGKNRALNAAAEAATGEVLVFTDANSMFPSDALRKLVRPLADPQVGGVCGDQRYLKGNGKQGESLGERTYWKYDRLLKLAESRGGNAIAATGAIYAIRRELYRPLPVGVADDFVASVRVITQGQRLVFEPEAVAYESVAGSYRTEFRRKVRVMSQALRAFLAVRELLNPLAYSFYAVEFGSHKVLRSLLVVPLAVVLLATPWLWSQGPIYQLAAVGQGAVYGIGALGWLLRKTKAGQHRVFALPVYFGLVNVASLLAVANVMRGQRIDRWAPQREDEGAETGPSPVDRPRSQESVEVPVAVDLGHYADSESVVGTNESWG